MKKLSKKWLLLVLAVIITAFPTATAFATMEVPQPEITEANQPYVETTFIEEADATTEETTVDETSKNLSANNGVTDFVTRMYTVCLNRYPDTQGLQDWSNALVSGQATGANIAKGFIFSQEFLAKNFSDTDYIKALYLAFFGREADTVGLNGWKKALEDGYSRIYVLAGFVNSDEFKNLCANYGINSGELQLSDAELKPSIVVFVQRLYKLCLLRDGDGDGLNSWTAALNSKQATGAQVAYGFVFSPEFIGRNIGNEEFVNIMYKTFFNREADSAGKQGWLSALKEGTHRQNVLAGFTNSVEFDALCNKYDVVRGTLETTSEPQPQPPTPPIDPRQDYYTFEETATEVKITGYKDDAPKHNAFNIPAYINGKPVTVIGKGALSWKYGVTGDIIIPDTVITIEEEAFSESSSGAFGWADIKKLDKLVIGKNVKYIGANAFSCSTLVGRFIEYTGDLVIPSSVEYIGSGAFSGFRDLASAEFLGNKPALAKDLDKNGWIRPIFVEKIAFTNYYKNFKIYYPKNAKGWPATIAEVGEWTQIAK